MKKEKYQDGVVHILLIVVAGTAIFLSIYLIFFSGNEISRKFFRSGTNDKTLTESVSESDEPEAIEKDLEETKDEFDSMESELKQLESDALTL